MNTGADYSSGTTGATERRSDGLTVLGLETSCDE
ncbi:hypothetical protein, partial [Brevundimonas sp.]